MDPQARMLLELTYEAIADAGFNPQTLYGTRTGVYIGTLDPEACEAFEVLPSSDLPTYAATGCSVALFANRVSYVFNFMGPSNTMNTACSSGFTALQQALVGLRSGQ